MVVSKLWLAGHLHPDLKPYTRHRTDADAASEAPRVWERPAAGKQQQQGKGTRGTRASTLGGSTGSVGSAELPPLAQLLTSAGSVASMGASGGSLDYIASSRSSILESITVGSAAPADIVQLLVESIALNSTANIYTDRDGERCLLCWVGASARIWAVGRRILGGPSLLTLPLAPAEPCRPNLPVAGQERRIGNRTEIALLELARLLGGSPRKLRRQQHQLAQVPGLGRGSVVRWVDRKACVRLASQLIATIWTLAASAPPYPQLLYMLIRPVDFHTRRWHSAASASA